MRKKERKIDAFDHGTARLPSRRTVVKRWLYGGVLSLAGGTAGYGALIEPHHPVLERVSLRFPHLPAAFEGLKIVQITDLHVQPAFGADALRPALELVKAAKPDLILITGDYINDDVEDGEIYMRQCTKALSELKAPLGIFASFGNHDFPPPPGDPSREPWVAAGITPLLDEFAEIHKGGDSIYVVGLRSFTKRPVTPVEVIGRVSADAFKIVLWHEPDRARDCAEQGVSLQLSGHTHGGQVVLPLLGPPVLPNGGHLYPSGLYNVGGMSLYVSRGVGLLSPRVRWNCPPEVTLLTLRQA